MGIRGTGYGIRDTRYSGSSQAQVSASVSSFPLCFAATGIELTDSNVNVDIHQPIDSWKAMSYQIVITPSDVRDLSIKKRFSHQIQVQQSLSQPSIVASLFHPFLVLVSKLFCESCPEAALL